MAASISAPLSAEPVDPIKRSKLELPTKSYADAVEETIPGSDEKEANGFEHANGTNGTKPNVGVNGHTASVIRIVDSGTSETKQAPQDQEETLKEEYSATVWYLLHS
jgi:2-acylglycerol O-acyltransferase 2